MIWSDFSHFSTAGRQVASVAGLAALVDRADQVLYDAKRTGRNRISRWPVPKPSPASEAETA